MTTLGKTILTICILLLVLAGGVIYYQQNELTTLKRAALNQNINLVDDNIEPDYLINQNQILNEESLAETRTIDIQDNIQEVLVSDQVRKISFKIPESWKKFKTQSWTQSESKIYVSPDYVEANLSEGYMGDERNTISKGLQVGISQNTESVSDTMTSEEYADFRIKYSSDCANCVSTKKIYLDNVPAVFQQLKSSDKGGLIFVSGLLGNKQRFLIEIRYPDSYNNEVKSVFENLLSSISFR